MTVARRPLRRRGLVIVGSGVATATFAMLVALAGSDAAPSGASHAAPDSPARFDGPLHPGVRDLPFPGRRPQPDRLDRPAPPLALDRWLDRDAPIEFQSLRGRPVLVRWWTDTCPFCESSMPVLESLHREFGPQGLAVLGVFHPKPSARVDDARVRRAAERFGVTFPTAIDEDWNALRRWWLGDGRGWTSVTFLVDAGGVLRWIHPGGEFHPEADGGPHWPDHALCVREYGALRSAIEALLGPAETLIR